MNVTKARQGSHGLHLALASFAGGGPGEVVDDAQGEVLLRKAGPVKRVRSRSRCAAIRGTRKTGMITDEIMHLLRGYDGDGLDPGLSARK